MRPEFEGACGGWQACKHGLGWSSTGWRFCNRSAPCSALSCPAASYSDSHPPPPLVLARRRWQRLAVAEHRHD